MKTLNNIKIIGIDHGYGNIKTANTITPTGVIPSANRPAFGSNILRCDGMYYSCGEGHKAFVSDKASDNDYYWLTLMGAAKELRRAGISEADVYLAAGLPLTWVKSQRGEFTNYLMRNERIEFEFNDRLYKLRFVGCSVFPQGYTAVIDRLVEMRGVNMLADIGNGTMNIMYITNSSPVASKCWTGKLGVNQCVSFDDVIRSLNEDYGVECRIAGSTISYRHPGYTDKNGKPVSVRGSRLGDMFTKKGIEAELERVNNTEYYEEDEYEYEW